MACTRVQAIFSDENLFHFYKKSNKLMRLSASISSYVACLIFIPQSYKNSGTLTYPSPPNPHTQTHLKVKSLWLSNLPNMLAAQMQQAYSVEHYKSTL
jgi:hypothetical protein